MTRISNASALAESQAAQHAMCHLAVVEFDGETVRVCDSFRNIIWDSNTYLACGDMVGFDAIEEVSDMQIKDVAVGMSGVDQSYLSDLLNRNYLDRPLKIYRAYLDDDGDVVGEPFLLFDGNMNEPTIQDDPSSGEFSISISASSQWADFDQTNGLRTNDTTHQEIFPGDKGFEFAAQILDQVKWGRK